MHIMLYIHYRPETRIEHYFSLDHSNLFIYHHDPVSDAIETMMGRMSPTAYGDMKRMTIEWIV